MKRPKTIAMYLPQFHPIPENDAWWGRGFTEWTNVARATPLYPGHYQPHVPADLGFYDLRLAESREAQAALARDHGIDAFCYYHYWFAGRRILERPFNEVLASGKPDFPFLLCWANESWTGVWHGLPGKKLIEQTYPGIDDFVAHFQALLPAFRDKRYLTIDGKPMFLIWKPQQLPDARHFTDLWRGLAKAAGLPGLHLVGVKHNFLDWTAESMGLDAVLRVFMPAAVKNMHQGKQYPAIYDYEDIYRQFLPPDPADGKTYPSVLPNWDNTPRSGVNGVVLEKASPALFRKQLRLAIEWAQGMPDNDRFIFIKAWNEWAEGNHLEPDLRYGCQYLEVVRSELLNTHEN